MRFLLRGHTDHVNAVKFFPTKNDQPQVLLSGSVDKTIRIWQSLPTSPYDFESSLTLESHKSSVNCFAVFEGSDIVASGSADATVKIWRLTFEDGKTTAELSQTIETCPRLFPLALALHALDTAAELLLAVAGTSSSVQVFVSSSNEKFIRQATLTGHEGWIRSLAISYEKYSRDGDLLLGSASQDKYIRLWRISRESIQRNSEDDSLIGKFEQYLSNKVRKIKTAQGSYVITFEALLLGHEDWIYTISWRIDDGGLRLLSSSADSSVAIWQSEESSGIWVCTTRLGEISAQKGSTTATGSTGGFWIGLLSSTGESLISLGRTGSWRVWNYDRMQARWLQGIGISGHTRAVTDIAWAKDGSYLLSTGSDQTTRLHAAWHHETHQSWHEMARPQIHGYDLNCIDTIGRTQFISGADEKLLRVFDAPRTTASLLSRLGDIQINIENGLPEAANIPVLGLSNKAIEETEIENFPQDEDDDKGHRDLTTTGAEDHEQHDGLDHPPIEDELARHTLWPEREKLYGHGYEISAVAASFDGSLIASSCRASALEYAVIRLYTTKDWREVKPSLTAHTLTVTALRFSDDDQYLLSVGRDRQWAVFERDNVRPEVYQLKHLNPKGHSRMILNACWAPVRGSRVFATAGRDKTIKLWRFDASKFECTTTVNLTAPVTAVDIACQFSQSDLVIASGTEVGDVFFHTLQSPNWTVKGSCELIKS